jgi:predicted nucleic acid-binding protein
VREYQVSGVSTHDTRIAAFMLEHHITHILTFNNKDFARYGPEGIVIITPQSIKDTQGITKL